MTREQALENCPPDSYVEYYANEWLIVPFAPVIQPPFFTVYPQRA